MFLSGQGDWNYSLRDSNLPQQWFTTPYVPEKRNMQQWFTFPPRENLYKFVIFLHTRPHLSPHQGQSLKSRTHNSEYLLEQDSPSIAHKSTVSSSISQSYSITMSSQPHQNRHKTQHQARLQQAIKFEEKHHQHQALKEAPHQSPHHDNLVQPTEPLKCFFFLEEFHASLCSHEAENNKIACPQCEVFAFPSRSLECS